MDKQLEAIIDKQFNELIKNFKPQFGNQEHTRVVEIIKRINQYSKDLKKKLEEKKNVQKIEEGLSRLKRQAIYLLKNQ